MSRMLFICASTVMAGRKMKLKAKLESSFS
jgi:hypothetical protein